MTHYEPIRFSVKPMRNFAIVVSALVHLLWISEFVGSRARLQGAGEWLGVIGLFVYGMFLIFSATRLKLEIKNGELRYRGFVSRLRIPIDEIKGAFDDRYDGGTFISVAPRFVRVVSIQNNERVISLPGTVGSKKHVERIKQAIVACLPEDHPQRKRVGRGPGGAHKNHDRNQKRR